MTRMQMKMMLTKMKTMSILKVMAFKVLRIKTFAIGNIEADEFLSSYIIFT